MHEIEIDLDLRDLALPELIELYRWNPDDIGIGIRLRELVGARDPTFGELDWAVQEVALAYVYARPEGAAWGAEEVAAFLGWHVAIVRAAADVWRMSDATLL